MVLYRIYARADLTLRIAQHRIADRCRHVCYLNLCRVVVTAIDCVCTWKLYFEHRFHYMHYCQNSLVLVISTPLDFAFTKALGFRA
jgi:hypothetical protein